MTSLWLFIKALTALACMPGAVVGTYLYLIDQYPEDVKYIDRVFLLLCVYIIWLVT